MSGTLEFVLKPAPGDLSLTAASDQWPSTSAGGTPTGWLDVKAFGGAVGNGSTDDTTAIQNTINAVHAAGGGTVYFPPGTYVITSALSLNQMTGICLMGAGPVLQYQTGVTKLLHTAASGHLLTLYSSTNIEIAGLQFEYNNAAYAGDLIDLDGNPLAADVQNINIHHCGSKTLTGQTARSILRFNKVVIATVELCHWTGAVNMLRIGDPGGSYVNVLQVEKCSFNFAADAQILVGTADGETLTIRDCTFEAGINTTAIRGATVGVDGAACNLYTPIIEGNWFGDASSATKWIDSLAVVSGIYTGTIRANRFASAVVGGTHLKLSGAWLVEGNSFENGTVFDTSLSCNLIAIANVYNNVTAVYSNHGNATVQSVGNQPLTTGPNEVDTQLQIANRNTANLNDDGSSDLFLGCARNTPIAFANGGAVYYSLGDNILHVQAPTNAGEVVISAGGTPTPVISVKAAALSFYNATPIARPSAVGSATGYAAGATAATFHSDDTYTGNVGSTAYTLNGIVAALKNLGLIAS